MNRRNFFQSIITGIGALVGYKYLPEDVSASDKIDITTMTDKKRVIVKPEDFNNDFSSFWYTVITTTSDNGDCEIQAYQIYPDGRKEKITLHNIEVCDCQ